MHNYSDHDYSRSSSSVGNNFYVDPRHLQLVCSASYLLPSTDSILRLGDPTELIARSGACFLGFPANFVCAVCTVSVAGRKQHITGASTIAG